MFKTVLINKHDVKAVVVPSYFQILTHIVTSKLTVGEKGLLLWPVFLNQIVRGTE